MRIGVDAASAPTVCALAGTAGAEPSLTAAAAGDAIHNIAASAQTERSAPALESRPIPAGRG